jgi:hypothetical protein
MVRKKILDNFQRKYRFQFVPCSIPVDKITEGDRLNGIVFQKTKVEDNRVIPVKDEFFEVETPLVISSIGSIPETIEGIPSKRGIFKISNPETCLIDGFDNVFAIGNAVTGKGNINESVKHSREISSGIIENFFEWQQKEYQSWHRQTAVKVDRDIHKIIDRIEKQPPLSDEAVRSIIEKAHNFQNLAGYDGNYEKWIEKNLPVRYEDTLSMG